MCFLEAHSMKEHFMELIVEGKGTFVGKHQGRLRVSREQKTLTEVPLIHLDQVIVVDSGVAISSDVIRVCSEEGIPIHFLGNSGRPIASLYSAGLTGTVLTRRAQLLAYENATGVALAKAFVTGKLENQANLLRYMAKYRKETDLVLHEEMMLVAIEMSEYLYEIEQSTSNKIDPVRETMLSM